MGYSMTHTETIIVHGKTMDMYPDKPSKIRDKEITVRITVDDDGSRKVLSLTDELRGIMLEVPLEPIENTLRWAIKMPDIQSAIDHIRTSVDVDPWAADMAEKALKKEIPQKWVYDRPGHWRCPACGIMMGRNIYYNKYCYNCGQKVEGADKEEWN